jgi:hypothetical protein
MESLYRTQNTFCSRTKKVFNFILLKMHYTNIKIYFFIRIKKTLLPSEEETDDAVVDPIVLKVKF